MLGGLSLSRLSDTSEVRFISSFGGSVSFSSQIDFFVVRNNVSYIA